MRHVILILSFVVLLACPPLARAAEEGAKPQPTAEEILAQQKQIRADLQSGAEHYRYVEPIERRQVYMAQRQVFQILEGRTSLDGLSADQHIALFNALKRIEAALVKEPGDEMVCERARLAGTGRYEMACMTRRERDRRAASAKEALMFRPACTTAECFGGD